MISAYREEIRALVPMVEKHLRALKEANGKAPAESVWLTVHVGTNGTAMKRIRNGLSILPETAMKIRETIEREVATMAEDARVAAARGSKPNGKKAKK